MKVKDEKNIILDVRLRELIFNFHSNKSLHVTCKRLRIFIIL